MSNPSKEKGTKGETAVVRYLSNNHGIQAQRRPLTGSKDCGDIEMLRPVLKGQRGTLSDTAHCILEVKSGKQTHRYNRSQKNIWLEQTRKEGVNIGLPAYLVINVYGKRIEDSEVWSSDGRSFWYLDEFARGDRSIEL